MNKNLYYGLAALSAVGLIGVGTASASGMRSSVKDHVSNMRGGGFGEMMSTDHFKEMSKIVGVDMEKVHERMEAGEDMNDIMKDMNIDRKEVHKKMAEHRREELGERVSEGKLTQEQADRRLERMNKHHKEMEQEGYDHKKGHGKMMREMMGH